MIPVGSFSIQFVTYRLPYILSLSPCHVYIGFLQTTCPMMNADGQNLSCCMSVVRILNITVLPLFKT